ncbi:YdeI/OmpD-associated family protein [Fructilactobacillus fructivorans]|uniref:YdeI/OmpD-associated family protein n=1 Tax=Fructilactobacillus fructivorans TaxID=1614 RepID=UPI001ED9A6CB|nr:hypothetical protein [Fructilactobacillus fructivorans]
MLRKDEPFLPITSRSELRNWFTENCQKEGCLWIPVSMSPTNDDRMFYLDIVEEALCFGWVDGLHKSSDETGLAQRLTPRKENSNWTELNKERARRLIKLGLMTDEGQKVLPDLSPQSFKIIKPVKRALKRDPKVWDNFNQFPDLYQRVRVDGVQSRLKFSKP